MTIINPASSITILLYSAPAVTQGTYLSVPAQWEHLLTWETLHKVEILKATNVAKIMMPLEAAEAEAPTQLVREMVAETARLDA